MGNRLENLPKLDAEQTAQLIFDIIRYTPEGVTYPVLMLCGPTGGGKTTFVQDVGRAIRRPVVVCELAGMEPPDIVGLPSEKDGICVFSKPWWFNSLKDSNEDEVDYSEEWVSRLRELCKDIPEEKLPDRILFMDEMNRAHPDTQNPVMNILLECRHQGEKMKHRTLIIGAGNISTAKDDYNVNEFGTAVRDRVRMIEFQPSFKEWVRFSVNRIHPGIIEYVTENKRYIRNFNQEEGFLSLRTLFRLGQILKDFPIQDSNRTMAVISAFLPVNIAGNVYKCLKNSSHRLKPEEILNSYNDRRKKVTPKSRIQKFVEEDRNDVIAVLNDKLYAYIWENVENLSNKQISNLVEYLLDIHRTLAYAFLKKLVNAHVTMSKSAPAEDKLRAAKLFDLLATMVEQSEDLERLTSLTKA